MLHEDITSREKWANLARWQRRAERTRQLNTRWLLKVLSALGGADARAADADGGAAAAEHDRGGSGGDTTPADDDSGDGGGVARHVAARRVRPTTAILVIAAHAVIEFLGYGFCRCSKDSPLCVLRWPQRMSSMIDLIVCPRAAGSPWHRKEVSASSYVRGGRAREEGSVHPPP